jgi:hypothetical protein
MIRKEEALVLNSINIGFFKSCSQQEINDNRIEINEIEEKEQMAKSFPK